MNLEQLTKIRHSASHLLAAAVLKLWPSAKLAIGPSIQDGFYYDFDFGKEKISEEDLPKIEAEMKKILPSWGAFGRRELTVQEARELFRNNPYKLELINEFNQAGQTLTTYRNGDFEDLCEGGHSANPAREINAFKLLSIAGAYWRGDEKNPMLTRIYGTCWPTQKELEQYLEKLEEAKKRDHRKLGKELDLFVFSDLVGKGLPLFTAKGATIRRELERFIVEEEIKRGYQHVYTPDIAKVELYEKSGHYPYYKESMYPVMQVDEERLILRPMTCPHHFQLYASRPRSYKELPIRIAELAKQYRYEKSGELTGLIRVRLFCLADAHIVCRKDQAESEINQVLDLIDYVANTFGLGLGKDYRYRLSRGNRSDEKKFYPDNAAWDFAENVLRKVLQARQAPFFEAEGEAAFYGPKIDIQMKNVAGKEETAFTVQYDFVMPKRFELGYIDQNGEKKEAVVIHRSSIGALERVIAFLIEHFAGAFPVWLHPVQVVVIPVSQKYKKQTEDIRRTFQKHIPDLRIEVDDSNETLNNKIRRAQLQKIPYMLIIGAKEAKTQTVSVRLRTEKDLGAIPLEKFLEKLQKIIQEKSLALW